MSHKCNCGSSLSIEYCCTSIIDGNKKALTAEQLMRSRYTAYTIANIAYIIETTHKSLRRTLSFSDIEEWSKENQWIRLEVLSTKKGQPEDIKGEVTFKANFFDKNGIPQSHHERSLFVKENDIWLYRKGIFL